MSSNSSSTFRAFLAISLMLFVIGFVVFKSGAIEKRTTTKVVDGKSTTSSAYAFDAGKIPTYLKSVVAPITGSKAVPED
ncbi:MAG: hypothetical protein PHD82_13545 [Candidatus Riflebacteria bacterium]|nr:hypothetical protein [Candidatus Riflebacteria bacterium]